MGIQDRDYWRERYNQSTMGGTHQQPPGKVYGDSGDPRAQQRDPTHWREDELYAQRAGASSGPGERVLVITTIIAVLCVTAALGIKARNDHRAQRAHAVAQQQIQAAQQQVAEKAMAQQAQRHNQLAQQNAREQAQRLQRAQIDADRQVAAVLQAQRAAAWDKFYQPSARCQRDATVECANAYIRAKRQFDAQYPQSAATAPVGGR